MQTSTAQPFSPGLEMADLASDFGNELLPVDQFIDDAIEQMEEDADYSVIGPQDDRFQIRARSQRPSTLRFPYSTICLLEVLDPRGVRLGTGTGTLIAPQVVLTAKHVLMNVQPPRCTSARSVGRVFPQIRVTPGADLSAGYEHLRRPATPSSIVAPGTRFRVDPSLDYGVIILPRAFHAIQQRMMLQPRGSANIATLLTIAGYPCDKTLGTMWGHSNRIELRNITPTHLSYSIDTCPGHSGSPIWLLGNSGIRLLLGIHTSGAPGAVGGRCENDPVRRQCRRTGAPVTGVGGLNCGVRVTCDVINHILAWCREFGVKGPLLDRRQYRLKCH